MSTRLHDSYATVERGEVKIMANKENFTVYDGQKKPTLHKAKSGVGLKSLFGRKGNRQLADDAELLSPPLPFLTTGHQDFVDHNDVTEANGMRIHNTAASPQSSVVDAPYVSLALGGLASEDLATPVASMPAKFMARQHLRAQLDQAHFKKVQAIAKRNAGESGDSDGGPDKARAPGSSSSSGSKPDPSPQCPHVEETLKSLEEGTPHLEVSIPRVEMERYSVMFERLLDPKQTILERRGHAQTAKSPLSIPREDSDSSLESTNIDTAYALWRSDTMPSLISPSLMNLEIIEVARPVEMRRAFGIMIGDRARAQTAPSSPAMHLRRQPHQQATCIKSGSSAGSGSETSSLLPAWSEASDAPSTPNTTTGMSTYSRECVKEGEHRSDDGEHPGDEDHGVEFAMVLDLEWEDDNLHEASFKEPTWESQHPWVPTPVSRSPPPEVMTALPPPPLPQSILPQSTFGAPILPQSTFSPSTPLRTGATRRRATDISARPRNHGHQLSEASHSAMSLSALERKPRGVANLAHGGADNDTQGTPTRPALHPASQRAQIERLNPLRMNAPRAAPQMVMGVAKQVNFGVYTTCSETPTAASSSSRLGTGGMTMFNPKTMTATTSIRGGGALSPTPGFGGASELVSMYSRPVAVPEPLSIYSKQPVKPRVVEMQPRQSTAVVLDNASLL